LDVLLEEFGNDFVFELYFRFECLDFAVLGVILGGFRPGLANASAALSKSCFCQV